MEKAENGIGSAVRQVSAHVLYEGDGVPSVIGTPLIVRSKPLPEASAPPLAPKGHQARTGRAPVSARMALPAEGYLRNWSGVRTPRLMRTSSMQPVKKLLPEA